MGCGNTWSGRAGISPGGNLISGISPRIFPNRGKLREKDPHGEVWHDSSTFRCMTKTAQCRVMSLPVMVVTENEKEIELCRRLLRMELSALKAYQRAMKKFPIKSQSAYLNRILNEHMGSATILNSRLMEMGVRLDFESGIRESFVKSIDICTDFFGNGSAVEVLMRRETLGQEYYGLALESAEISPAFARKIECDLLPKIHQHLLLLETLANEAKN